MVLVDYTKVATWRSLSINISTVQVHRLHISLGTWFTVSTHFGSNSQEVLSMPWNERSAMDQRTRFIADYLDDFFPFAEFCLP